jgi:hypothetical protein
LEAIEGLRKSVLRLDRGHFVSRRTVNSIAENFRIISEQISWRRDIHLQQAEPIALELERAENESWKHFRLTYRRIRRANIATAHQIARCRIRCVQSIRQFGDPATDLIEAITDLEEHGSTVWFAKCPTHMLSDDGSASFPAAVVVLTVVKGESRPTRENLDLSHLVEMPPEPEWDDGGVR